MDQCQGKSLFYELLGHILYVRFHVGPTVENSASLTITSIGVCKKLEKCVWELSMEVASPISFTPVQAGTKRPYVCSPLMEASGPVSNMDVSEDSMLQPNLKRRRFAANDSTQHSTSAASMIFGVGLGSRSPFATVSGE